RAGLGVGDAGERRDALGRRDGEDRRRLVADRDAVVVQRLDAVGEIDGGRGRHVAGAQVVREQRRVGGAVVGEAEAIVASLGPPIVTAPVARPGTSTVPPPSDQPDGTLSAMPEAETGIAAAAVVLAVLAFAGAGSVGLSPPPVRTTAATATTAMPPTI